MPSQMKQTYLDAITCKPTRDLPFYAPPYRASVGFMDEFEKGPVAGGRDGFGVLWEATPDGSVPSSREFLLKDIADWESVITFPDVEAIDWRGKAEKDLANVNLDEQFLEYGMGNGHFERLVALMGFENGLCALLEDPESCERFMEAFTEYRIAVIRKIAEYYHPDAICSYDDVAHLRGTFMSLDCYRELIKPYHKAVNDECRRFGILPLQHCCGKAQSLIPDFIDEGAQCWTSAQPVNDIKTLLAQYGDRISISGGFDVNVLVAKGSFTEADIRQEVRDAAARCAQDKSFILGNLTIMETSDLPRIEALRIIADEALHIGKDFYEKERQ